MRRRLDGRYIQKYGLLTRHGTDRRNAMTDRLGQLSTDLAYTRSPKALTAKLHTCSTHSVATLDNAQDPAASSAQSRGRFLNYTGLTPRHLQVIFTTKHHYLIPSNWISSHWSFSLFGTLWHSLLNSPGYFCHFSRYHLHVFLACTWPVPKHQEQVVDLGLLLCFSFSTFLCIFKSIVSGGFLRFES